MNEHKIRAAGRTAPEAVAYCALGVFGGIAAAVTVIAVVESYSNLYAFAASHGLHGWRAAIAPAAVDSFIIMGELLLFAAILLAWDSLLAFGLGAGMAAWGFGLSVAGNVWHASAALPVDRAVAAIWPVTATAGMAGGLIIIKRLTAVTGDPGAGPGRREPRQDEDRPRPARAARVPGPAPAAAPGLSEAEQALALQLAGAAELPSARQLAGQPGPVEGSRRRAGAVLEAVRAGRNGHGSRDGD